MTALRAVPRGDAPTEDLIRIGDTILFRRPVAPTEISTPAALSSVLNEYVPSEFRGSQPVRLKDSIDYLRHPSQNGWTTEPCIQFDIGGPSESASNQGMPTGPFVHHERGLFAESIQALVRWWMFDSLAQYESGLLFRHNVILPDRRGRLVRLEAQGNDLAIHVDHDPAIALACGVAATGYRNQTQRWLPAVANGVANVALPWSAKSLAIWLLDSNGKWLDQYFEDEHRSTWPVSLYNEPRTAHDDLFKELDDALRGGESLGVEFKAWIPAAPADAKSRELLETVVAFANAAGGVVYIGVNRNAAVDGVAKQLRKQYAAAAHGDFGRMQDAYARDLRQLIREGVSPDPHADIKWVMYAQEPIVVVSIDVGDAQPYSLSTSGDILIRTAATNRRLRHADIDKFFKRKA